MRLSRHPYVVAPTVPPSAPATSAALQADLRSSCAAPSASTSASTSRRPSSGGWRAGWRCGAWTASQDYLALLQREPDEVRALYEDILIHVTSFFRDPEVFEALKAQVFPAILKHKPEGAPIRIWVAGCSTGEEVYSLAIALLEFLGRLARAPDSDLRLRRQREGDREGARRPLPRRALARRQRRAAPALLHQGRARLPHQQDGARSVRLRPARPGARPAVLEAGPGELSQRPHLLRSGAAEADRADVSLRVEPAAASCCSAARESISGFGQLFSAGRQDEQDLRAHGGRQRAALRARAEATPAVQRPAAEPDARAQVAAHGRSRQAPRPPAAGPLRARRASSSTRRWRSSSFAGRPARFCSRRRASRRTTSSRWRARAWSRRCARRSPRPRRRWRRSRRSGVEVDQGGFTRTCDLVVLPVHRAARTSQEQLFVVLFEDAAAAPRPKRRQPTAPAAPPAGRGPPDPEARARAGRHQGVSAVADRGARADQRRARLGQRGAGVGQRRAAEHERGAGDREGGAAVDQRGADHRQRRAAQPQPGGHPESTATC